MTDMASALNAQRDPSFAALRQFARPMLVGRYPVGSLGKRLGRLRIDSTTESAIRKALAVGNRATSQ